MPKLGDVYKKSGLPTHTFVEPSEFNRVIAALQTQGRGLIVEGPSGIGKTSCIKKALESQSMSSSCAFLSARREGDLEYINHIHTMKSIGVVVIDDFHRLPENTKKRITDYMKVLADEEDNESKVILIGINRAGQSLIEYAPDLLHRVETVKIGRTSTEKIEELIGLGERALNCTISTAAEIVQESEGSFGIAQVLCYEACLQGELLQTSQTPIEVNVSLPRIRENVIRELALRAS